MTERTAPVSRVVIAPWLRPLIFFLLLIGSNFGIAMLIAGPAYAADKVTLMLNWYIYGGHAPFYYGKEGLFVEQGIDLEIQEGRGSGIPGRSGDGHERTARPD